MSAKKFRDRVGRFAGDDEIEIAHDFLAPAKTSRHAHLQRIIVRGQIASQLFGLSRNLPELKRAGVLGPIAIGVPILGLVVSPKPGNPATPPQSPASFRTAI